MQEVGECNYVINILRIRIFCECVKFAFFAIGLGYTLAKYPYRLPLCYKQPLKVRQKRFRFYKGQNMIFRYLQKANIQIFLSSSYIKYLINYPNVALAAPIRMAGTWFSCRPPTVP